MNLLPCAPPPSRKAKEWLAHHNAILSTQLERPWCEKRSELFAEWARAGPWRVDHLTQGTVLTCTTATWMEPYDGDIMWQSSSPSLSESTMVDNAVDNSVDSLVDNVVDHVVDGALQKDGVVWSAMHPCARQWFHQIGIQTLNCAGMVLSQYGERYHLTEQMVLNDVHAVLIGSAECDVESVLRPRVAAAAKYVSLLANRQGRRFGIVWHANLPMPIPADTRPEELDCLLTLFGRQFFTQGDPVRAMWSASTSHARQCMKQWTG